MKAHLFMAIGLTIAAIFFFRGVEAITEPGLGLNELYIIGGFIVAGLVFRVGWRSHREKMQG